MATYIILLPRLISAILLFGPLLCGQSDYRSNPMEARVVSFHRLQHQVPRAARAEMDKAENARRKNRPNEVMEHLRNAVRIDPEYVEARNNLAVCLVQHDPAAALAQLKEAIDIDPHEALLFHNLAVGYVLTNELDGAERAARSAVDLDRTNLRMRTLLGMILVMEHKYTAEALADLAPESRKYPLVELFAAEILINQNEVSKAKSYIDDYLQSGEQDYREIAERWRRHIDQTLATTAMNLPDPSLPGRQ